MPSKKVRPATIRDQRVYNAVALPYHPRDAHSSTSGVILQEEALLKAARRKDTKANEGKDTAEHQAKKSAVATATAVEE